MYSFYEVFRTFSLHLPYLHQNVLFEVVREIKKDVQYDSTGIHIFQKMTFLPLFKRNVAPKLLNFNLTQRN